MKSIIRCVEAIRPPPLLRDRDPPQVKKDTMFNHARKVTPLMISLVAKHRSIMICENTHVNIILLRKDCSFAGPLILKFMEFKIEDLL
jgi:hypothetical protein